MASVTILGTGRMGAALAIALARAGHAVTAWNRTEPKARALEPHGVRVARSIVDAMDAELVIGVTSDYESTTSLLHDGDVQRALGGRTFLQLATGTPAEARELAAWAAKHDVRYFDGAIMATPEFIGRPGCTIVYSGPPALHAAHAETLRAVADAGMFVGVDVGHANVLDSAILSALWGATHGAMQGAAMCEAETFSLASFREALRATWPVVEPLLFSVLERIERRHWAADASTESSLAPAYASIRHVLSISEAHGIDATLPKATESVFRRAVERGHLHDDLAAAYVGLRSRRG